MSCIFMHESGSGTYLQVVQLQTPGYPPPPKNTPPPKKKLRNESAIKLLLHKIVNFVTHQAIIYELICYRMTFARKYISRQFFCLVLCFIEE